MFRIKAFRHAGAMWLEATLAKRLRTSIEHVLGALDHLGRNGCEEARQAACALRKLQHTLASRDGTLCWQTSPPYEEQVKLFKEDQPEPPFLLKVNDDQAHDEGASV